MKWVEISVLVGGPGVEPVAALFHRLSSGGVAVDDPQTAQAFLEPIDEDKASSYDFSGPGPFVVKAYFHEDRALLEQISAGLAEVENLLGSSCVIQYREVQDEDWEDSWKKYYHSFRVGRRLVIKPSWEQYDKLEGDLVIEIDPGMAFGTGSHASTRFCLLLIEQYIQGGERVIDAGCGSGILSLAAAQLGASEILAIDLDRVAVQVAQENVDRNGLANRVKVVAGDIYRDIGNEEADVILANLTADVILPWLPTAVAALKSSGLLFASGIQDSRWPELRQAMEQAGLAIIQVLLDADWVGVAARRL